MILSEETSRRLDELAITGNRLVDRKDFQRAITAWQQAVDLLPEPKQDWEAYTWLSASIGDSYFQQRRLLDAKDAFENALNGPGGTVNPFIQFRTGQILFRLGDEKKGVDHLLRAYMLDGEDVFVSDAEGAEFLGLLRRKGLVK